MSNIASVNSEELSQLIASSSLPILVDFWAPWCGPCKMMMPILEEVAITFADKIKIVKVNADENQDLVSDFKIKGLPTLIIIKDGNSIAKNVGALQLEELSQLILQNT
jgi:thioredoxin 1